ncbi:heme exporter protein CcmB [Salibacter sp.]|uniref:heme exporter protein CcmB n=1 Tax=Salibacter sp. TaxID=2010995 RepID=UPI00286FDEE8|nr:heme exporter protein CcmB [Salibacter sp.]MDR9399541.1 heme exporter protein CcmB [Salibacter sp.]MDR9488445.1 heme exporter protein CcmB [Salibacter sp.]
MFNEFTALLSKEVKLEWRNKFALGGLLLYVVSTAFVAYLSFKKIVDIPVWNALFWIIFLFGATNAVARAFVQDSKEKQLYLYTLASPQAIILSKMVYNGLLLFVISVLTYIVFGVLVGNPIQNPVMYLTALILGSTGFSGTLSLLSAIASQTQNNVSLLSILGFPILLPLLMTLLRLSKNAADGISWTVSLNYVWILLALNTIVFALSYLLFPYLWRE